MYVIHIEVSKKKLQKVEAMCSSDQSSPCYFWDRRGRRLIVQIQMPACALVVTSFGGMKCRLSCSNT